MPEAEPSEEVATRARRVISLLRESRKGRREFQCYLRLIDLLSQLEIWIKSEHSSSNWVLHLDEVNAIEPILSLLFELETFAARLKHSTNHLNLRRLLYRKDTERFYCRLEECFKILTQIPDTSLSTTSQSVSSISTPIRLRDLLLSLDVSPDSATKSKLNTAVTLVNVLKEALTPVPVVGGFLSAGFSLTAMVLEKCKAASTDREVLKDIRRQLRSIIECFLDFGILTLDSGGDIIVRDGVSVAVQRKVQELVNLATEVKLCSHASRRKFNSQRLRSLSMRVAEFKSTAMHAFLLQHRSQEAEKRYLLFLSQAASTGLFFYVVRK